MQGKVSGPSPVILRERLGEGSADSAHKRLSLYTRSSVEPLKGSTPPTVFRSTNPPPDSRFPLPKLRTTNDAQGRREQSTVIGHNTLNFLHDGSSVLGWSDPLTGNIRNFLSLPGGGCLGGLLHCSGNHDDLGAPARCVGLDCRAGEFGVDSVSTGDDVHL